MGGMWVRRMLTVVQFTVAIALTTLTLAIAWQTRFAAKVDLGFDPIPLLVMELPGDLHSPVNHALREALSHVQGVESVAANADPIGKNLPPAFIQVGLLNGKSASVLVRPVSPNFFDTYRLRPVAGRLFNTKTDNDEDGFAANIINVSTARELGFANPQDAVGQLLTYRMADKTVATGPIVGVAPDIRYHSLHGKPQPILYFTTMYTPTFTVRVSGNMQQVEAEVDALVRQYFPNDIIRIRHAGDYFADSYADDRRLAALLGLGTVIAIMLTAFGIYALSSYSVQRMSRTIVLHKLFGAGATDVARLVGREFVAMIVIGAAIGLPVAILAVENYMVPFSERAPTGIWPEVGAVLAVVVVTLISTLKNTVTAIRLSPVRALRD
jgi:putative ABC transport system permease protein